MKEHSLTSLTVENILRSVEYLNGYEVEFMSYGHLGTSPFRMALYQVIGTPHKQYIALPVKRASAYLKDHVEMATPREGVTHYKTDADFPVYTMEVTPGLVGYGEIHFRDEDFNSHATECDLHALLVMPYED